MREMFALNFTLKSLCLKVQNAASFLPGTALRRVKNLQILLFSASER